jgi:hypothetical protein
MYSGYIPKRVDSNGRFKFKNSRGSIEYCMRCHTPLNNNDARTRQKKYCPACAKLRAYESVQRSKERRKKQN